MIKKKVKRIRPKGGDVLQVNLNDGTHAYAQVSNIDPLVIFYDYNSEDDVPLEDIVKLPIAFKICVFGDVVRSGRWPRIGNLQTEALNENSYFYKQDMISGALAIYHDDYVDTNYERPATLSEIQGLESATVWDWGSVEERLQSHFAGTEGDWVKDVAIDKSKVPSSQRK